MSDLATRLSGWALTVDGDDRELLREAAERIRELEAKSVRATRTLEHPLDQWLDRPLSESEIRFVRINRSVGRTRVQLYGFKGQWPVYGLLGSGEGERVEDATAAALNDAFGRL